ncbi:glutaconate CoA-transferase subunit A [Spirochaetia bacterium]|nr:glutaconate CoA-transferase subunit A [Spirochaetia bacterium]
MNESKLMTAREAVSRFLNDGDLLTMGGFSTSRRPYALAREIIRQGKKGLYLEGGSSGGDIDMLIGAGCIQAMIVSYIANSGYSMVCRRFRSAIEKGEILFDDYSLDVHTIAYHGAALGLPYMPVKNMLGSDLVNKWGISKEERAKHPKLPALKYVVQDNPFKSGDTLCLVPTPEIDAACIHVQTASPDGTCRIAGLPFQDADIAIAARRTIISCEELVTNEEIRRHPGENTLPGLCVDAVVLMPYGAHPSQCYGYYDYDSKSLWEYEDISKTQETFDAFIKDTVMDSDHDKYLDGIGAARLLALQVDKEYGYVRGMKRSKKLVMGGK